MEYLSRYQLPDPVLTVGVKQCERTGRNRRNAPGELFISSWTLVEFASAMARLDRMGSLQGSPRVITALLDENVKSVYTVVSPIETAYRPAQSLLLRDTGLGLRGPDALHLATAARHDFMIHLFMPGF